MPPGFMIIYPGTRVLPKSVLYSYDTTMLGSNNFYVQISTVIIISMSWIYCNSKYLHAVLEIMPKREDRTLLPSKVTSLVFVLNEIRDSKDLFNDNKEDGDNKMKSFRIIIRPVSESEEASSDEEESAFFSSLDSCIVFSKSARSSSAFLIITFCFWSTLILVTELLRLKF